MHGLEIDTGGQLQSSTEAPTGARGDYRPHHARDECADTSLGPSGPLVVQ